MFVLVVAAASWAAWNTAVFTTNPQFAYRAESAWLLFATILILSRLVQPPIHASGDAAPAPHPLSLLVPIIGSIVLYQRIFTIGLLSDDFILLPRALAADWVDPAWTYLRPLPLAAWWAIDRITPAQLTVAAVHVFGVVLHGVNAWLVCALARRAGLTVIASWIAAGLFLSWPFNVEAVAWPSAVFDVCVTACALGAALIASGDHEPSPLRILGVSLLTAAAVASKETGVVLPLMLLLVTLFDSKTRRSRPYIIASTVVVALYLAVRFTFAPPPTELYGLAVVIKNKLLTRPFGTLGLGIHRNLLSQLPWIGIAVAIGWAALFARAARRWNAFVFRTTSLAVCWVLVSVAPLWTMLFVTDTLENSRYLYMASSLWAIAVTALIANGRSINGASRAVAIGLVVGCAIISIVHQESWRDAAGMRDRVMAEWNTVPPECDPRRVTDVPDSVAGAYVFRNGFPEAVEKPGAAYRSGCSVSWQNGRFLVKQEE